MILDVTPGGPADKAGLRPTRRDQAGHIRWGNVITAIDDHPVKSAKELYSLLENQYQVGQEVTVTYERGDEEKKAKITLGADAR